MLMAPMRRYTSYSFKKRYDVVRAAKLVKESWGSENLVRTLAQRRLSGQPLAVTAETLGCTLSMDHGA